MFVNEWIRERGSVGGSITDFSHLSIHFSHLRKTAQALLIVAMKFVLGGSRSAPPKTNFIAGLSNATAQTNTVKKIDLLKPNFEEQGSTLFPAPQNWVLFNSRSSEPFR